MNLPALRRKRPVVERGANDPQISFQQWLDSFSFQGLRYTLGGQPQDEIQSSLAGVARGAYKSNGIVFACMLVRMLLFSEARFLYRRQRRSRPGDLFGFQGDDLQILRVPWAGGTTGDLLARMIQYADVGGNAFVARRPTHLFCARPDWVTIIGGSDQASAWDPDAQVLGYVYEEGGPGSGGKVTTFLPEEMAHFAPIPDPELRWRGVSWLTPIVREVMADKAATDHKLAFFENGATPNLVVKIDTPNIDTYKQYVEIFKAEHEGAGNAYRTMFLGAGADATVVGSDLKQLDFKVTQGAGETRIAAAAGVPPVVVGLSEGLQGSSLNAGNFAASMRRLADGTMRPLWRNVAGSLARIIQVPSDAELWYDDRDIPFLKEDTQVAAQVQSTMAQTIKALIDAGFESDSVVAAVTAGDLTQLQHTGLFSVQLQPAGSVGQGKGALVTGTVQPAMPAAQGASGGRGMALELLEALVERRLALEEGRQRPHDALVLPPAAVNVEGPTIHMPDSADGLSAIGEGLESLARAIEAKDMTVNVTVPEREHHTHIAPAEVNVPVTVPERSVTVEAPVTVQPAEARVEVPVTVQPPERPRSRRIEYPGGSAVVTEDRVEFDDGKIARITDL